jgi:hypothetical protein
MSSTTANAEKRTDSNDIRPATIFLGVDSHGLHHVYRRDDDVVHVIDPALAERKAVIARNGRDLEGWMHEIDNERGWASPEYGVLSVDTDKFRPRGF